jgi:predicted Zn-dependent protease
MRGGIVFLTVVTVLVICLLVVYFFVPLNTSEFAPVDILSDSEQSFDFGNSSLQFYQNMRYQSERISYRIYDECTLKKKNDMEEAFRIISNITVLEFYPVVYGEEISITCSDENIFFGDAFVGGEGGVTNVTVVDDFHVIFNGEILLIRDSQCPNPNIAIHELLHALGFDHSENPNNIMYETSSCSQSIGDEIPHLINELYVVDSKPDLSFENVTASLSGRYLNVNLSLRNNGFKDALASKIIISIDGKPVNELDVSPLEVGYGSKLTLSNLWINQITVEEIEFFISADFEEIDKSNNVYVLLMKK